MRLTIAVTIDSVTFDAGVIAGTTSLGGSESACLGLARGLQARGHDVHIFTTKLADDAPKTDHAGVAWHPAASLAQWGVFKDWDVLIALRQPQFLQHAPAKFRVLWSQDLMASDSMKQYVMSLAWAYDAVAYVSKYHQAQWETTTPELTGIGWATKNGHDAALAAEARTAAVKNPHQLIHISRPERGLAPLLRLWPQVRQAYPDATVAICRYSSMYDKDGWGQVCAAFDRDVAAMNAAVGGITYLGELGKPALYQAIANSAAMWYPGVSTFAETSCIAAIEAQACGTPFIGSFKGALPETVPSGVLIPGVAEDDDPAYDAATLAALGEVFAGCAGNTRAYRERVAAGLQHVQAYTYEAVAAEWESFLLGQFAQRYETEKAGILRRLDHDDDLVAAKIVAAEISEECQALRAQYGSEHRHIQQIISAKHADPSKSESGFCAVPCDTCDAYRIEALADRVITGKEHTAAQYAEQAMDPRVELARADRRLQEVVKQFVGCRHVVDVACGPGAFTLALALDDDTREVVAIDYAQANIDAGKAAAEELGLADRITWICAPVWDYETGRASGWLETFTAAHAGRFDGLFCGEFLEHVADCSGLVRALDRLVKHQGRVVYTVPQGPLNTLVSRNMPLQRGHVHAFRPADLDGLFGRKEAFRCLSLPWVLADPRGDLVGNWLVTYRRGVGDDTGTRPLGRRLLHRPYKRLSVGVITNSTLDLRRCLDAVWQTADEIVLGDTGCPAGELDRVLAEFPRKVRVIQVPAVQVLPGGFSEARNRVLAACTGEWFLWIDADETLCGVVDLGKYLDGPVFMGYAIPQNHLHLDASMGTDTPIRLFRRVPAIQFYGCIHEQPQLHDCNGAIVPALQVADVQIAHLGYLHEAIRREKALTRNLPLLVRDRQMFPDRELGSLLVLRDYANLALWTRQSQQGALTAEVQQYYANVVGLFEEKFMDPAHTYHALARPFYESALRSVAGAMEVEIGMAVGHAPDGLGQGRAKATRVWVRTPEHLAQLLAAKSVEVVKSLKPDQYVLDCEPLPQPTEVAA